MPGQTYTRYSAWRAVRQRMGAEPPPGEGYRCGSNGAYFVLPTAAILFCGFPVCPWADQTDVEVRTGKLAYMAEHTHRAARA